eukprot:sb/3466920/
MGGMEGDHLRSTCHVCSRYNRIFQLKIGQFSEDTKRIQIKFLDQQENTLATLKLYETNFTMDNNCGSGLVVDLKGGTDIQIEKTDTHLEITQKEESLFEHQFPAECAIRKTVVYGWKIDQNEDEVATKYKLPMVISHIMDERLTKGYWGRALTASEKCSKNTTIEVTCAPLLVCWKCEASDEKTCFEEDNSKKETCNMNVLQCYLLKTRESNGNIKVIRGCGEKGSSSEDGVNTKTCEKRQEAKECGRDGRVCFCRECYGRLCNDSPLFKAAQMSMKSISGTITGLSTLVDGMSKLLRAGMFDVSMMNELSANTTTS